MRALRDCAEHGALASASWRRSPSAAAGLPGSSLRTRPSFSRAEGGLDDPGSWIRRRRGRQARKRGLQRSCRRAGAKPSAKSVKEALGRSSPAMPCSSSDANRAIRLPQPALGITWSINRAPASAPVRGAAAHPDGQPPQPDPGFLRGSDGIATKYLDSYLSRRSISSNCEKPSPRPRDLEARDQGQTMRLRFAN